METIGLIAGNRKFPLLFCQSAKKQNYRIVAVAIRGDTSPAIKRYADSTHWLSLGEFSRLFEVFQKEGVKRVVMAGQISPWRLFSKEVSRDPELSAILSRLKDKRADTIFGAIADKLRERGFQLLGSVDFLADYLPGKGQLTKNGLSTCGQEDAEFGFRIAKELGRLDIGQAVAVKDKAVVAVEALEGTDRLIRRAGAICGGGFTVVKVSKPAQDIRFDVPVVGLNTVRSLASARGGCLAIEAGKTLFIDQEEALRLAERKGIAVVAV